MQRWLIAAGLLLLAGTAPAAESREVPRGTQRPLVVIENDLYTVTFDPDRGGRATSFIIRENGRELVYDGKTAGFFLDHFGHQYWPGELLEAPYEYSVSEPEPGTVSIVLARLADGGRDRRDLLTKGVLVYKTITLRDGDRAVHLENGFHNPTTVGKNVGMWIQQAFAYGGDRLFDFYYRPSSHGVHTTGLNDDGTGPIDASVDAYSNDFVGVGKYTQADGREPVGGWTAGRDRRTNEGGVFILDYNYLDVLYNSANSYTTEWWLDSVPLPGGKSWATKYMFVPVDGFTGFSHADNRLIANVELNAVDGAVRVRYQFAGTTKPLGKVTVQTRLYGVRSKQEATLPPLTVAGIGLAPQAAEQVWKQPQTEPLVSRVTVSGEGWQVSWEDVHKGAFAGEGVHGAGSTAEYEIPRPKKEKVFLKPDSWARPVNAHPRVLVVYGLFTNHYGIEKAIQAVDPEAEVTISASWDTFPPTYDTLLGYDLIVLSNIPVGPDYANVMVADAVREAGIGLLTLGGLSTYGGGQWRDTALMDVFPATVDTAFDFQPLPAEGQPTGPGTAFPTGARFYWAHQVKPKPGATILLRQGETPLAIAATVGKGRVIAVTASCFGEAAPGQTEAWTTDAWTAFLTNSVKWLTERN